MTNPMNSAASRPVSTADNSLVAVAAGLVLSWMTGLPLRSASSFMPLSDASSCPFLGV